MTKEEIENYIDDKKQYADEGLTKFLSVPDVGKLVENMVNDFLQSKQNCTGCIHEPKRGDVFRMECGECSRWYGDRFERKDEGWENIKLY